jgi:hypothetical protein
LNNRATDLKPLELALEGLDLKPMLDLTIDGTYLGNLAVLKAEEAALILLPEIPQLDKTWFSLGMYPLAVLTIGLTANDISFVSFLDRSGVNSLRAFLSSTAPFTSVGIAHLFRFILEPLH